jgi:hypothetical protein
LLLPEVTTKTDDLRDVWDGLGRVHVPEDALVVVLTPHGSATGVYAANEGSLTGFGVPAVSGKWSAGPVDALGLPALEGPLDHGALVPLLSLGIEGEVLTIALDEVSEVTEVVAGINALARERDVFVIASAHTSTCLTERAPLPYSFDAVRLESRLITGIESDCGAAALAAEGLASVGGSCSRTTLEAFGGLFSGVEGTVLAYGCPFGVGYPVVTAEIDV